MLHTSEAIGNKSKVHNDEALVKCRIQDWNGTYLPNWQLKQFTHLTDEHAGHNKLSLVISNKTLL